MPDGKYYNEYFPGHAFGMPPQLFDEAVAYEDEAFPQTTEQYASDVSAFLMWLAEPHLVARKESGLRVIVFLLLFAGLMWFVKQKLWGPIHRHNPSPAEAEAAGVTTPPPPASTDPKGPSGPFLFVAGDRAVARPSSPLPSAAETANNREPQFGGLGAHVGAIRLAVTAVGAAITIAQHPVVRAGDSGRGRQSRGPARPRRVTRSAAYTAGVVARRVIVRAPVVRVIPPTSAVPSQVRCST